MGNSSRGRPGRVGRAGPQARQRRTVSAGAVICTLLAMSGTALWAQDPGGEQGPAGPDGVAAAFSGLARLDVLQSRVTAQGDEVTVTLYLSQPVPWRFYLMDRPARLVVEFRELDWRGADAADLIEGAAARGLRFGAPMPGWSRMELDLAGPAVVGEAEMVVSRTDGTATVTLGLRPVEAELFAAATGAPQDAVWDQQGEGAAVPEAEDMLTVAIDAAMSEGLAALGREIAEALERTGTIRAVVVRSSQDDETDGRVLGAARGAGADVLLLLDPAQAEGLAAGGTAIPPEAAGQGDEVALVLTELARRETVPQAARLVAALSDGGVGAVAVAEVPDIVTVLVGPDDAGEAQGAGTGWAGTPDERREVIARIAAALGEWATGEAVQGDLLRQ